MLLHTKEQAQQIFDAIRNHAEVSMRDIVGSDAPCMIDMGN